MTMAMQVLVWRRRIVWATVISWITQSDRAT
jgi:hypothetical protein